MRSTALLSVCCLLGAGCASLPDSAAILERHTAQAARFETARGPLSRQKSAALLAALKRKSGDLDILEKQMVLEQTINGSPLLLGNRLTLLQDGPSTYAAMFAAIRQARDHINLESYIFEDDEIGREFADLLLESQARGVQVNLIYDSVGAINTPRAFFQRLQAGGINVLEFNPLNPLSARRAWRINNRDHRKLLIVDGRSAFLGGINISSVHSSGSIGRALRKRERNPADWRDTDVQVDGPVVAEFQKLFLDSWARQQGQPMASRAYFPVLPAHGQDMVRAIGSRPEDPFSLIYLTLISALGNAEQRIQLTQAYFVPDPSLLKALMDASARGVEVSLILPQHSDSAIVFHAGRAHYGALLKAGVRLFERRGAPLHAKTASIDGVWSCIGSSNLDWRSFLDNDEVNAVVLGRDFGTQMESMFARDLANSEAITQEAWEARSHLLRFKEWGAGLLQRLL